MRETVNQVGPEQSWRKEPSWKAEKKNEELSLKRRKDYKMELIAFN
jgi:hypothetical protein